MATAARTVSSITQRSSRNDDARRHRAGFQRGVCCGQKNVFVQQWQKEFPEFWSDEQLARNVPMRVEFEQVYVFVRSPRLLVGRADLVAIPEEVEISVDGDT